MLRPLTLALAAVLHGAPAWAACGPADADFTAPPALAAMPVSVDLADERVLLGRNGERVATRRAPVWMAESGDPLPQTWMDKVDWSAYRQDGGESAAPTRLYFDTDGRLCRALRYDVPRRGGSAGAPFLMGGFSFEYDAEGRLARVIEYEQTAYRKPAVYSAVHQTCLKRDAQGALTALIEGPCDNARTPAASRHFLRDAAGRLLRVIDANVEGRAVSVQAYDGQGRPGQRYLYLYSPYAPPGNGNIPYPYAEPPPNRDSLYVLERERLSRLATEVPGNEWRIVRVADDVPVDDADMQSWNPGTQTILAQGVTDPQGRALLDAEAQEKVWQAMHDKPGRIFWYQDPVSRMLLVPAMDQARWQACSDPANLAADACG
ncbi:hypothetical protein JL37_17655 [Achromobacter sp. RTa]|uniref:hypothetical protein n=1 Tax=Achromobacter sp. RTa TaxID=1532557 RepID=UPI00050DE135|nr:hypothetical protein [Achromobacter sp. RTa]KGD92467.1 hypothetical protein JL37_17655 [Achromobacter sp. RTa]